jgi:hypothetical protein
LPKVDLAFSTYQELKLLPLGGSHGSLSGTMSYFIWLSKVKLVYRFILESTHSSSDGNLSLHLKPGAFQQRLKQERGKEVICLHFYR